MTKRQAEALNFIRKFIAEKGYAPSCKEIAAGLQLASPTAAHRLVMELEGMKRIRRRHGPERARHRSIEVVEDAERDTAVAA